MITKLDDSYLASPSALMEQIIYEYQKDSWGEGKLFYLYKRLFRNITTLSENITAFRLSMNFR